MTRTVARSFAPDVNFYLDFPCPLLWTEAGRDAVSLAEILDTAELCVELWHQASPNTGTTTASVARLHEIFIVIVVVVRRDAAVHGGVR